MDYLDVNELYRLLNNFDPTLTIEQPDSDFLIIRINEYLTLSAAEANEMLLLNNGLTHWHMDTQEMAEGIIDVLKGNFIFVERRSIFAKLVDLPSHIKIIEKSKFEKIKHRYMGKRKIRIYSGNKIIQRAD
jgi:hypothetical protein